MKKYLSLLLLLSIAVAIVGCGDNAGAENATPASTANPNDTPTEAYKRLYAAVKSKNTEAIKAEMSKTTQSFAEVVSKQQNKPVEVVYANGFTQTTFAESLPEIRDERVKDNMGAVEVWNAKGNRWEDLPFVREEAGWKLAIGDAFQGSWKSPGRSRDSLEKDAANVMSGNSGLIRVNPDSNINTKTNTNTNSNIKK